MTFRVGNVRKILATLIYWATIIPGKRENITRTNCDISDRLVDRGRIFRIGGIRSHSPQWMCLLIVPRLKEKKKIVRCARVRPTYIFPRSVELPQASDCFSPTTTMVGKRKKSKKSGYVDRDI